MEALHALQADGHRIFICTGRTWHTIYDSLRGIGFDGIIAGAGAHIVVGGKEIHHHYIPAKLLKKTAEGIFRNHFTSVFEGTDNNYYIRGDLKLSGNRPVLSGPADAETLRIEKFTIHSLDHEHIRQVWRKMPELCVFYDVYPNNSGSLCEFVYKGQNKASAVDRVLAHYGAELRDTVAFGDSMNDFDFLRHAAVGVAMGNAPNALRDTADVVTEPLDRDGVVLALRQMGLIS